MHNPKNIYLSDDDEDDRLFFKTAFEEVCPEHNLRLFDNNVDLLEKLKQTDFPVPDILFIDLYMPRINGLEFLRNVRDLPHLENVPIVVYSTIITPIFVEEVHALGAAYFIKKPYNYYELAHLIKHIIDLDLQPGFDPTPMDEFVLSYKDIKKPLH